MGRSLHRGHREDDSQFDRHHGGSHRKRHVRPPHHARAHDCQNSGRLLCRGNATCISPPGIGFPMDFYIMFFKTCPVF